MSYDSARVRKYFLSVNMFRLRAAKTTPLYDAVVAKNTAIIQILLDCGSIDVNLGLTIGVCSRAECKERIVRVPREQSTKTPLTLAQEKGYTGIADLLRSAGAS